MKFSKKVILASIACALLPLLLIVSSTLIISFFQLNRMSENYKIDNKSVSIIQNPTLAYNQALQSRVEEFKNNIAVDPSRLDDREFLDSLNESLEKQNSTLFVKKGVYFTYVSDENLLAAMKRYLPANPGFSEAEGSLFIDDEDYTMLLEVMEFSKNQENYIVYIAIDVTDFLPEMIGGLRLILASVVILTIIGIAIVVVIIYRIILRPVGALSKATHQIMEGNLDFEIKTTRRDEIGQLQTDFENMRVHLKETTEQNIAVADSSKVMMSNISHDLKTPLTAIKGYAEGLLDGVADTPEKQTKYIKTIYTKACAMEELVEDLAYFSKLDNQQITYQFTKINVKEYIEDCVDDLAMDVEVKNIRLMQAYQCDDDIEVLIDPTEIRRVIGNIITNSIKYMDKDEGEIRIRVLNDNEFVWITIEDNGRGISQAELPHIFDRFYRADTSRGTKTGGTGLGLAIVKSIVEAHGGTIYADSVKGTGTSIRFSIPRVLK